MEEIIAHQRPIKRAKLDATQHLKEECALKPWIHQITTSPPSDYERIAMILQTIHSTIIVINDNIARTTTDDPTQPCVSDASWISLRRVLTLRLGYMTGSLSSTSTCSHCGTFLSLAIICLRNCYERISGVDHESIEIVRTVVDLLNQLLLVDDDDNDDSSSLDRDLVEILCQNSIELFDTILCLDNDDKTNLLDRSLLEELALVLVKVATSSSRLHNPSTTNNRVSEFFQRQSRQESERTAAVFYVALQVLDYDDGSEPSSSSSLENSGDDRSDEDELFRLRCLALVARGRLSNEDVEHLIQLIPRKDGDDDDSFDTSLSVKVLTILQHCTQHLTLDQIWKSSRAILDLAAYADQETATELLPALGCLEALLSTYPTIEWTTQWEELWELCSTLALEISFSHQHEVQSRASSLLLVLLSSNAQQTLAEKQKRQVLTTLSRVLVLSQTGDITSRAIQLVCAWIVDNEDQRREILDLHPDLLVSLAQLVTTYRVTAEDQSKIANAFWTILKKEPQNSFLARQSKVLECVVAMASQRSPVAESSSSSMEVTRGVAVGIILTLSENPCNRRILAKHPGLLSSMIHFVRQLPNHDDSSSPPTNHHPRACAVQQRDNVKKQILLLAKAL